MDRKWVHFLYAMAGLVTIFLLIKTGDWVWSLFAKPKPLILYAASFVVGSVAIWLAWRSEELFGLASECVAELSKVSWPTRRETGAATLVVIVTVIIASIFLGIFDALWAYLTGHLYG
jgi:preprotein translocase subunit SecE